MIEHYFQDEYTTIYHGDCRNILQHLLGIGACVSDVPYGMQADFKRRGLRRRTGLNGTADLTRRWQAIKGDDKPFEPSHLLGYPIVALFGANHFADKLPAQNPRKPWKWLIWDKRCGSGQDDNSDAELIWTNQTGAARIHYQKWRGIVREGEENLSRSWKFHPAQKPVSLMRWVIGQLKIKSGTVILDPYMGSGSTLVAAKQLGYKAIGIEIVKEYCDDAVCRLSQGALQFAAG